MYRYASDAQDMACLTDLLYLIRPYPYYFPILLMEKGGFETTSVKFVIETSIQAMKPLPFKSEEVVQNHLMFCNSVMIAKMFKK